MCILQCMEVGLKDEAGATTIMKQDDSRAESGQGKGKVSVVIMPPGLNSHREEHV